MGLGLVHAQARVEIVPVTIGEAKESFTPDVFQKNEQRAFQAGVTLMNELGKTSAQGHANGSAFLLFYNSVSAPDCGRDYVIQRVKLTKTDFNENNIEVSREETYLVEIMKTKNGRIKKPDEHVKLYKIGTSTRRHLSAEAEVGCAEIPGVVEGNAWPREPNKLYAVIQDYSTTPGHYFTVRFDDSASYRFDMDFTSSGNFQTILPSGF
jgi:hypothetical protein